MRSYPIDSTRVRLVATGNVAAVPLWVEMADGSRRPDPNGRPSVDANGVPLWTVEVIVPADTDADARDRTEIVTVTIASPTEPDGGSFGDVLSFTGLMVTPGYVKRGTGQLSAPRWTADAVGTARNGSRPAPAAASGSAS